MEDKEILEQQRQILLSIKDNINTKISKIDEKLKIDPLAALKMILSKCVINNIAQVISLGTKFITLRMEFSSAKLEALAKGDVLKSLGNVGLITINKSKDCYPENYEIYRNGQMIYIRISKQHSVITPILKELNFSLNYSSLQKDAKEIEEKIKICKELENDITSN